MMWINLTADQVETALAALEDSAQTQGGMTDAEYVAWVAEIRAVIDALEAGQEKQIAVDEPDKFGTVKIWPFRRDARESVVQVDFKDDGTPYGVFWKGYLMSVEDTRQYAFALLEAVEVARQRPAPTGAEGPTP